MAASSPSSSPQERPVVPCCSDVRQPLAQLYLQLVRTPCAADLPHIASLPAEQIVELLSEELIQPRLLTAANGEKYYLQDSLRCDSDAIIATMRREISRLSLLLNEQKKVEAKLEEKLSEAEAAINSQGASMRAQLEAEHHASSRAGAKNEKLLAGLQARSSWHCLCLAPECPSCVTGASGASHPGEQHVARASG